MIDHKFSEEDLRRYIKCKVHLKVSSEGMEATKFQSLCNVVAFMGLSKQTLTYTHKHKRPLITRQKDRAKDFFIKWLEST